MKNILRKSLVLLLTMMLLIGTIATGGGTIKASAVTAYEILDKLAVIDSSGYYSDGFGNLQPGSKVSNNCWQYVKRLSSYCFGTTVTPPSSGKPNYLSGKTLNSYYRVKAALTNCSYEQIADYLKEAQPGDLVGLYNSKVSSSDGHIIFIGNNTGTKLTVYQEYSGTVHKNTISLTASSLKNLGSFGYSGNASFASSSYGVCLFRCSKRTGQRDFVYSDLTSTADTTPPTFSYSIPDYGDYITLKYSDNVMVAGYYFGTSSTYSYNPYTALNNPSGTQSITASSEGFYYLTVQDTAGNISGPMAVSFYRVTFDANGGSVYPSYGIYPNTRLTFPTPSRAGFSFIGWNTNPDGSGTYYSTDKPYYVHENITFYAIWSAVSHNPIGTFDYVEDRQGAIYVRGWAFDEDDPTAQLEIHVYIGGSAGVGEGHNGIIANTYRQDVDNVYNVGAYHGFDAEITTNLTGSQPVYVYAINIGGGENAEIGNSTVTISELYKLTFNANNGSGAPAIQYGNGNITLSSTKPTRNGYTFLGWSTDFKAAKAQYQPGATFNLTQDTTLYAIWKKNTYTLTYNANGGSGAPAKQTGNGTIALSSTKPTRSGYTFLGWATDAKATKAQYQPGAKYNLTQNSTLYAVWKKNVTYTLTYNANGGSVSPASVNVTAGGSTTLPTPTRSGYTFTGWNTKSDGSGTTYKAGASYKPTANTTLYAQWKKNVYTLTYNANGGSGAPAKQTGNGNVTISGTSPYRSGYMFLGWTTVKTSTVVKYKPRDTIKLTSDLTLYAVWQKNPTPTVAIRNFVAERNIDYRSTIVFHAVTANMTDGYTIRWLYNGQLSGAIGETARLTEARENFTIQAIIVDSSGKTVARSGEETVYVYSGLFDRIIAFFLSIFGGLPYIDQ